jgi:hypothetical protein
MRRWAPGLTQRRAEAGFLHSSHSLNLLTAIRCCPPTSRGMSINWSGKQPVDVQFPQVVALFWLSVTTNASFNPPEWSGHPSSVRWAVEVAAAYERLFRFCLLPDDTPCKFPAPFRGFGQEFALRVVEDQLSVYLTASLLKVRSLHVIGSSPACLPPAIYSYLSSTMPRQQT